uniref:Leucine carboxyl methyltransferase 1 n=1 Tax=Parascaris univalens TaxID=6257 RepID=A0A915BYA0_PARUN
IMDQEADMGDGQLSAQIGFRRRSTSVSDDYSVQKTNDDATECKFAAVSLNYYKDDYLKRFVAACGDHRFHRDPEISRGYWARVTAIRSIIDAFLQQVGPSCQIVNIGSGFDTLYWRLKEANARFYKFVDVDFSSVTAKKIHQIRKPGTPNLVAMFSEPPREAEHSDMHAGDYELIGADLRQPDELKGKLELASLDFGLPTLFIAECVLVYMGSLHSGRMLAKLATWFTTAVFVNYEQVNMKDSFGEVMEKNLQQRGIVLPGLTACANIESQKQRFLDSQWEHVDVWTMNEIYQKKLSQDEVKRIEAIELLDERELLTQLLHHYCIAIATKGITAKYPQLKCFF